MESLARVSARCVNEKCLETEKEKGIRQDSVGNLLVPISAQPPPKRVQDSGIREFGNSGWPALGLNLLWCSRTAKGLGFGNSGIREFGNSGCSRV